jgi:hypothetical protein
MKSWSREECCVQLGGLDPDADLAGKLVFEKVFRSDFEQPGFAILVLDEALDSYQQRRLMVRLKEALSCKHEARWGDALRYLSLGRFDQQSSTKLHLDGAPERSFLMLGYEPTAVRSEFQIADFSCCAHEMGILPKEFLCQHNPMFGAGAELLRDYTTTLTDWHEDRPRIVVINNSSGNNPDGSAMLGVMHGAAISEPQSHLRRVINSTMMAPSCLVADDAEAQVEEFVTTDRIAGPIAAMG